MTVPSSTASVIWLIRHGETEWSRTRRHTSVTDLPLTAEGEAVAAELGARLAGESFELVLSSPRLRARRTAELAGFGDATLDADLAEWAYGNYEGITTSAIQETVPGWSVWTHPSPGGETAEEVATRLDRVVERVANVSGSVLIFGHGHALRAFAARWLGQPVSSGAWLRLDTATISQVGYERDTRAILRWNS